MKKSIVLGFATLFATVGLVVSVGIAAAGPPQPGFYVDGTLYRTVGTPTDFSDTGAPAHAFDTIYDITLSDSTMDPTNVASAAPGDRDFNGGRWMVHGVVFTAAGYDAAVADAAVNLNGNDVLDSAEEVEAAIEAGYGTDVGIVKMFECPVIKLPGPKS